MSRSLTSLLLTTIHILFVLVVVFAGPVTASATKQFKLNTDKDASSCFLTCANEVANSVNLPGKNVNFIQAITLNCEWPEWKILVGQCLPITCISAPDVAYAVEYATDYCARGGVYGVQLQLPSSFLSTPGGAYYNSTLSSSATSTIRAGPFSLVFTSIIVVFGLVAFL